MKYFVTGLLLGAVINFLPIFKFENGKRIFPEWTGSITGISSIRTSPFVKNGGPETTIDTVSSFHRIDAAGSLINSKTFDENTLHNLSGSGKNYITYQKVGNEISFYNSSNEIFWKHSAQQYPYLSYNGKFILLLIADLSGAIILDSNANATGAGEISGKLLNSISFAEKTDFATVGFIDGSYYALDQKGDIISQGNCGEDKSVKTTAISSNGRFLMVHYGSDEADGVKITDIEKNSSSGFSLTDRHLTKTGICVNDEGTFSVINRKRILTAKINSKKPAVIDIPEQLPGESSISFHENLFYAVFRTAAGSAVYAYDTEGNVIFSKIFPEEQFLQQKFAGNSLILRGTDNLYCYSFLN